MLDRLKQRLVSFDKVAGVEILLLQDGSMDIRLIVLAKVKNKIQVQQALEDLKSIDQLKAYITPDMPIALVINGRGILNKKVSESFDRSNSVQLFLPNAKPVDFYQQVYQAQPHCWVSIVRRNTALDIMNEFQQHELSVVSFSTGALGVLPILALIAEDVKEGKVRFSEHTLTISNEQFIDYTFDFARSETKVFTIDEDKVSEQLLNSYSAALGCLLQLTVSEFDIQEVHTSKEEFEYQKLFKLLAIGLGIFFTSILLLNFVLFSLFSQKNNELLLSESQSRGLLQKMGTLENEVKEKNSFLSEAGWLSSLKSSFYADRIAVTIPASVKLTELTVNPINDRKTKELRKTVFESGLVKIAGSSNRPTDLNEWIDKIKAIPSVKKARLLNYTYDQKERVGNFNVEIIVED
ncbi:MAG: hypothetical protein K0R51_2906 [Cytophagaceae bacterium]|jgi:hypothetical protein|nr:hypothetical protein [Cytophagaceae bacterium]